MGRRIMEWAARSDYMGGIPRKMVIMAVGGLAKAAVSLLNNTTVHNADTLLRLVRSRPPGVPLVTVSNHMSTMDDPLLWGFKGFPITDAKLSRWALAAEDICFKSSMLSYFFRLGKCIPIIRGGGIYQEHMNEALERLSEGEWLHTFPEGKVSQEDAPIRRLKWGTASLIARAPVTPIVLPIVHTGFEQLFEVLENDVNKQRHSCGRTLSIYVMPENFYRGKRPPFPLWNKNIKIIVGEPMELDLPKMRQMAMSLSRNISHPTLGWPSTCPDGLDEAAQRCLYIAISEKIQNVMETLRTFARSFSKSKDQNLC
ncbi:PREDICTED: tafazzin [Prunus dulcis]|uniref:Tafazzin family protein n=1 Tax=Prunus dulcis TaxID=3755 RepID=A0A5E4E415_PRUDU|nr:PREDICTED: tafazzin [Prunus dulcis]